MKLPWRSTGLAGEPAKTVAALGASEVNQSSVSLGKALDRLEGVERPRILDLGSGCGATAVFLAQTGAHVSVEDAPDAEAPAPIPFPDETFHLVLAWEILDYVAPERLSAFGGELVRVIAPTGWLIFFSLDRRIGAEQSDVPPARYRVVARDELVRESLPDMKRTRWYHPNRELERALHPLSIQGIHLQRNQMREVRAFKKP